MLQCFSQSNKFELRGILSGKQLTTMVLGYPGSNGKIVRDTVHVKNDKFLFSGKIKHPVHAELYGLNSEKKASYENYLQLFLEPCRMNLFIEVGKFSEYKLEGSKTQKMIDKLNTSMNPIQARMEVLDNEIKRLKGFIKSDRMDSTNDESKKLIAYELEKDSLLKKKSQVEYAFIIDNPNLYTSPYLLQKHLSIYPPETLRKIYLMWPKKIRNSSYGESVNLQLLKIEASSVNNTAPDFSANTYDYKTVRLSSFRHKKVVLIDFWASWCIPCRQDFPDLIDLYNEFSSKGLEIISISIDTDTLKYLKAIEKEGIGIWKNILMSNSISNSYFVPAVPVKYLVSKEGIILGIWHASGKESIKSIESKLMKELGLYP